MDVLFDDADLGAAWDTAGAAGAEGRLNALRLLADNRDKLPGAVFFEAPPDWADSSDWSHVVELAEPRCECPTRYLLVPSRGRSRFVPGSSGRQILVANGPSLHIAPWGGDNASALLRVGIEGIDLKVRAAKVGPHSVQEAEERVFFAAQGFRPDARKVTGWDVADAITRSGEIICSRRIGEVFYPAFAIVEVTSPLDVVIELDASVSRVDPANPRHFCVA